MKTVSLLRIVRPPEGDLRPPPAKLRLKVLLRWLLCIIVSAGVPDLAWAQYRGGGYATGSAGDRDISRSTSSQALRDYRTAQQPAQPYVRRQPSYGADYARPSEGQRR